MAAHQTARRRPKESGAAAAYPDPLLFLSVTGARGPRFGFPGHRGTLGGAGGRARRGRSQQLPRYLPRRAGLGVVIKKKKE